MRPFAPLALTLLLAAPCAGAAADRTRAATAAGARPVAAPAPAVPVEQTLAIPVPANARVRLDFDTRGDDLLGIMKNFLKGFNGNSIIGSLDATRAARAPKAGVAPQGSPDPLPGPAATGGRGRPWPAAQGRQPCPPGLHGSPDRPGPAAALRRTPGDLASPALPAAALQDICRR